MEGIKRQSAVLDSAENQMLSQINSRLEEIAPENYRFYNEPSPIAPEELERYLNDLRREAASIPGLISIYQDPLFLSEKAVRIKLILVYKPEDLELGSKRFADIIRIIGTRNILDEECINLDSKLLENFAKLDPLMQPRYLSGQKIPLARPQDEEIRFFFVSRLLDLFTGGYLEKFYQASILRDVDTCVTLNRLRDFQRLLEMVKIIIRKRSEDSLDRMCSRIQTALQEWNHRGIERYRLLMDILDRLPGFLIALIDKLKGYFERAMVVKYRLAPNALQPQALLVTERMVTVFVEPWEPVAAFQHMLDLTRRLEQFVSVLPVSFALQLHQYSTGSSSFNKHIKSTFRTEGLEGNLERPYITWERGHLLDRYHDLLIKMKEDEDYSGWLLGCEVPGGSALSRATDMVSQQKSKLRLKKMLRFLQDEVQWISSPANHPHSV